MLLIMSLMSLRCVVPWFVFADVFLCLAYVAEFEIHSLTTNSRRDLHVLMVQHKISGVVKRFVDGRVKLKISAVYRDHDVAFWNDIGADTVKYANVGPVNLSASFLPYTGTIRVMAVPSHSQINDDVVPSTEFLGEIESIQSPVPSF